MNTESEEEVSALAISVTLVNTFHDPQTDTLVKAANDWVDLSPDGYGLARDFTHLTYKDNCWHLTVLLRTERDRQHFTHSVQREAYRFGKGGILYGNGWSAAFTIAGVEHYFGSRKV